jgi:hypothetical protein
MKQELLVSDYMSAALLRSKGVPMREARPTGNGRVEFVFERSEVAQRLLEKHEVDGVQVNSQKFVAALNSTKTALFSARGR